MKLVITAILIALSSCLIAQEVNLTGGTLLANEVPGDTPTKGYQINLGARYIIDRDTTDDFFLVFFGGDIGWFNWRSQIDRVSRNNFSMNLYAGFTPTSDVYFSANAKYLVARNAFVPHLKVEIRPFDRFLWTENRNLIWSFFVEGGYIKYIEKPTSPTGYVSVGTGISFGF